jgi:Nucleotide-diphospho-sugar transferase
MLEKSLFICYSTPNYSKLTNIFLNSLHDIKVNNINHMTDDVSNLFENTGFQTDLWYYCVRNKINHLIHVLQGYDDLKNIKYFIFTDCDIIYIKKNTNEWYNLENYIQNENNDIHFMRENITNDVNSGFFIIKNNNNIKNIINFFIEVLQTFDMTQKEQMPFGDQSIINNLKGKINYGFIPNDYVVFGSCIYNRNKSLFHHAVCCNDVDEKIIQINQINDSFR